MTVVRGRAVMPPAWSFALERERGSVLHAPSSIDTLLLGFFIMVTGFVYMVLAEA